MFFLQALAIVLTSVGPYINHDPVVNSFIISQSKTSKLPLSFNSRVEIIERGGANRLGKLIKLENNKVVLLLDSIGEKVTMDTKNIKEVIFSPAPSTDIRYEGTDKPRPRGAQSAKFKSDTVVVRHGGFNIIQLSEKEGMAEIDLASASMEEKKRKGFLAVGKAQSSQYILNKISFTPPDKITVTMTSISK